MKKFFLSKFKKMNIERVEHEEDDESTHSEHEERMDQGVDRNTSYFSEDYNNQVSLNICLLL